MLIELLVYVLCGLLLAYPLARLLRSFLQRRGRGVLTPLYLRPYVPAAERSPTDAAPKGDGPC